MHVRTLLLFFAIGLLIAPASAEITLSQLIVDLSGGARARDVEVYNDSEEKVYVSVEPREIINPGRPNEQSMVVSDPEKLGLLVSPRKLILQPHERKLIRIADLAPAKAKERVYRVTVKPEVGAISSSESGLKLLVGYDMLVLARPAGETAPDLVGKRTAKRLTVVNRSGSSVELESGRQCDSTKANCRDLGGKRLYSGADWTIDVPYETPVNFKVKGASGWSAVSF